MLDLLKRICSLLEETQIDYMLSGSLALNIYTTPRMTRDIDIVIALQKSNLSRFLDCFPEDSFYISKQAAQEAVRDHNMFNVIDYTSGFKLDFIVLKQTPYRQMEFQRRVRTEALGFSAYLVKPEDLILSKLIWIQELDSERQRLDIQQLLALDSIDRNYLQDWARRLKIKTFGYLDYV